MPMTPTTTPLLTRKELDAQLGGAARAWLDEALAEAEHAASHEDSEQPGGPYAVPSWELRYAAMRPVLRTRTRRLRTRPAAHRSPRRTACPDPAL